jgi:hypothetical protein
MPIETSDKKSAKFFGERAPRTLVAAMFAVMACAEDVAPGAAFVASAALTEVDDDEDGDGHDRLQSDDVAAVVAITRSFGKFRLCQGEDGEYQEAQFTFSGTSAGDPRLTGQIEITGVDLFNITELHGPEYGRAVIRDAATGRKKVEGAYNVWSGPPGDVVQGTIVGRAYDDGDGPEAMSGDGTLIANVRLTFPETPTGPFTGNVGGVTSDSRLPAGLWSGRCTGKWTPYDRSFDLPGLTASGAPERGVAPRVAAFR